MNCCVRLRLTTWVSRDLAFSPSGETHVGMVTLVATVMTDALWGSLPRDTFQYTRNGDLWQQIHNMVTPTGRTR